LSGPDLEKNLLNLTLANQFLGGNRLVIQALSQLIDEHPDLARQTIHMADVGCGAGDILRTLAVWAKQNLLRCKLTGIDANPVTIEFATRKSRQFSNIEFLSQNIYSQEFKAQKFDVILLCTVCHHFNNAELINLFKQLKNQANIAIIVSDLHRHWLAYYAIKVLTRIIPSSYLEKHDGPLSVLKSFKSHEIKSLLESAGIECYQIKWRWPFRYQLIIYRNI
jgi:2-polyprenyl-3-methyl-5-hydroxy-6-metoxy-1,4-benzoquinol methylase